MRGEPDLPALFEERSFEERVFFQLKAWSNIKTQSGQILFRILKVAPSSIPCSLWIQFDSLSQSLTERPLKHGFLLSKLRKLTSWGCNYCMIDNKLYCWYFFSFYDRPPLDHIVTVNVSNLGLFSRRGQIFF